MIRGFYFFNSSMKNWISVFKGAISFLIIPLDLGCINTEIMMSDELLAKRVYSRFTKKQQVTFPLNLSLKCGERCINTGLLRHERLSEPLTQPLTHFNTWGI